MSNLIRLLLLGILLALAACDDAADSEEALPTSAVMMLRQLATVGPTQIALAPEVTTEAGEVVVEAATLIPTSTPSPTPYIGVFLGRAEVDPLERSATQDAPPVAVPTRSVADFADLLNCPANIAPSPVFGRDWQAQRNLDEQMGCAIQQMYGFTGEVQIFDNGAIYYNPDTNEVWAIAPGILGEEGDFWYVANVPVLSEAPAGDLPNVGLLIGGIGGAWGTVPELRAGMGFPVTEVQSIDVNVQRFDGGTLFLDVTVGQVFVLAVNGDAFGPF